MPEHASDPVERLAEVIRQTEVRLPDVQRARGAVELVARLRREASTRPPVRPSLRHKSLWLALGLAAAAGLLMILLSRREAVAPQAPAPVAHTTPAGSLSLPAAPPPVFDRTALAVLRPMEASDEGGRSSLEARPGEDRRAWLADCGRVVLRGEAALGVEENGPDGIALRLHRGTLLVSFDRDSGRALTVRTRDALVRVTGTVFAVTAGEGPTRVAVSRGSVEVAAGGLPISVTAGKSWRVGAASLHAPEPSVALALRELHALDAPRGALPPARSRRALGLDQQDVTREVPSPQTVLPAEANPSREREAEAIYRAAESALRAGQSTAAKQLLADLVREYPHDPLATLATFELGRLAFSTREYRLALRHLQAVRDSTAATARPFHEPAAFLVCRIEVDSGEREAGLSCLAHFRKAFPDSPHDSDALALAATLRLQGKDCTRAVALVEEYLRLFPDGSHAQTLKASAMGCR